MVAHLDTTLLLLHIITKGRFWDENNNALYPNDGDEKFGVFKQKVLQAK